MRDTPGSNAAPFDLGTKGNIMQPNQSAPYQGPSDTCFRIALDYIEMPGLKLTLEQSRRLWNLPVDVCESALNELVASGFLGRSRDGAFLRAGLSARPASATKPRDIP
jgi:hypothetical protein